MILVGLGNPGDEYKNHRHNIGFMAVDAIAENIGAGAWKKKFQSFVADGMIDNKKVLFVKPQTYMNLSGNAVREILEFYNFEPENVIVFHDDIDLVRGDIRIKQGGSNGGHNGLKSLDEQIGLNYKRVRLGIGRPMTEDGEPVKGDAVTNFVLSNFSKSDKEWLEKTIAFCVERKF